MSLVAAGSRTAGRLYGRADPGVLVPLYRDMLGLRSVSLMPRNGGHSFLFVAWGRALMHASGMREREWLRADRKRDSAFGRLATTPSVLCG